MNVQDVTAIEAASIPCLPMSAQSAAFGDVVYVHQAVSVPVDERCHCLGFSHKLSIDDSSCMCIASTRRILQANHPSAYLRRYIVHREAGSPASDDEVEGIIAVGSLRNRSLDLEHIIRYNGSFSRIKSSAAFVGEGILQGRYTFVS